MQLQKHIGPEVSDPAVRSTLGTKTQTTMATENLSLFCLSLGHPVNTQFLLQQLSLLDVSI